MASSCRLPWYIQLLGEQLIPCRDLAFAKKDPNRLTVPTANLFSDRLKDKKFVIGLYYTPIETTCDEKLNQLTQLYESINVKKPGSPNSNSKDNIFEIIQVTLGLHREDKPKIVVDKRYQDLPWYAIPIAEAHSLMRLTRKYEIKTLSPALVLLDGHSGELITKHGLDKIQVDPTGTNFPWTPQPLPKILENVDLLPGGGSAYTESVSFSSLAGLIVGFYFSAHWCPPCRCFTPQLIDTYKHLRERNIGFDIIFVSSDRSRDSFDLYLQGMPWLAVPFPLQDCRLELAALFGVQGIPTLVVTDADGSVITMDGRGEVNDDPQGLKFPWRHKLVNILTDRHASRLQEKPGVVLFIDGDDAGIQCAERVLTAVATHFKENTENDVFTLEYFIASDTEPSDTLRDVVGLDDCETVLSIINLPEATWCHQQERLPLRKQSVIDFVAAFLENKLPALRLGR